MSEFDVRFEKTFSYTWLEEGNRFAVLNGEHLFMFEYAAVNELKKALLIDKMGGRHELVDFVLEMVGFELVTSWLFNYNAIISGGVRLHCMNNDNKKYLAAMTNPNYYENILIIDLDVKHALPYLPKTIFVR